MIFVHKVNTLKRLFEIENKSFGIETDVRWNGENLILTHDLYDEKIKSRYYLLDELIDNYNLSGPIIFNIKSSGCEERIIDKMIFSDLEWYFLDSQLPDIIRLSKVGFSNRFILRLSQFETLNKKLYDLNKCKYIWIDSYGEKNIFKKIKFPLKYSPIYVSHELHLKPIDLNDIPEKTSICTDFPENFIGKF